MELELEKICIPGIANTYAISNVKKEFRKAVDEPWKDEPNKNCKKEIKLA